MKRLLLAALLTLTACGGQSAPPDVSAASLVASQAASAAAAEVTAPPTTVVREVPAKPVDPPVTFGGPEQSWVEVGAAAALRPTFTTGLCHAEAFLRPDNRVQINPVDCAFGQAAVIVDDGTHRTPQTVGDWYLIVTQRAQSVAVAEPSFKVFSGDQQLWP